MMQNIWLAAAANPISIAAHVEQALRKHYTVTGMGPLLSEQMMQALQEQGQHTAIAPPDFYPDTHADMQALTGELKPEQYPDLYLWIESEESYYPKNIDLLPCKKACYFTKYMPYPDEHIAWAKQFDYIFVTHRQSVDIFKAKGMQKVFWLPTGFTPEIYRQTSLLKKHEVSYTGSVITGSDAERMLIEVQGRFPLLVKHCHLQEMADVLSQSKIHLLYNEQADINRRVFETLGVGTFLLTNPIAGSGIDELFNDGEEIVFFTADEVFEKLAHYLDRGSLREKIAQQGYEMAKTALTYEHRCADMLNVVSGIQNDTPTAVDLRAKAKGKTVVSMAENKTKEYSLEDILQFDPGFPKGRSFIIPVLDLKSQTEFTFHTLLKDLESIEGDVIAVFNSPEMAEVFRGHPRITYSAAMSHNVGVARAWNIGLHIARTPVSFILNSDLHITPEVIDTLEKALLGYEKAAIVGVEGGYIDFFSSTDIQRFIHGTFSEPMLVDNVSGFFFGVKTELFQNGTLHFEDMFTPCYYEEWDLGLQVRAKNLEAYIIPAGGWEHEFNTKARTGDLNYYNDAEPVIKISDRNQKLYWKKWLSYAQEKEDASVLKSLWFGKKKAEGEQYLSESKFAEATAVFTEILQKDPVDINSLYYLGFIHYLQNNKQLAEQFFVKVLEINPETKQAKSYLDAIRQGY